MIYTTITDAITAVLNSGVSGWDWGTDAAGRERDSKSILEELACFLYGEDLELDDDSLARFIVEVLGDDPAEYSIGK